MLKNTVNMNEVLCNKHTIYETNVIIRLYHYTYSYTYRRMTIPYSFHKTDFTLYFFSLFSSNIFDLCETVICFACGTYFLHYILNTLTKNLHVL